MEALIRAQLTSAFPSDSMLGEEDGGELGANAWIVDPIDGTINFVHGVRYWCVSIAFVVDGERRIGVVYDPSLDELFWAVRGGGRSATTRRYALRRCLRVDRVAAVRRLRAAGIRWTSTCSSSAGCTRPARR